MKIIFLDIDGPIISTDVDTVDSELRITHIPETIDLLNELCKYTGAKIVTNSSHNYNDIEGYTLKDDLIAWGLDADNFHENWRTIFPYIDYSKIQSNIRGIGRFFAIDKWQEVNGACDWVCFDDRKFTVSFRLILIENAEGIKREHIDRAIEILGPVE